MALARAGTRTNVAPKRHIDIDSFVHFGLAIHNGQIFATGEGSVLVFDETASGSAAPLFSIAGSNTEMLEPSAVMVDDRGEIIVSDIEGDSIEVFVPPDPASGSEDIEPIRRIAGPASAGIAGPAQASILGDTLYMSGFVARAIVSMDLNGTADAPAENALSSGPTSRHPHLLSARKQHA